MALCGVYAIRSYPRAWGDGGVLWMVGYVLFVHAIMYCLCTHSHVYCNQVCTRKQLDYKQKTCRPLCVHVCVCALVCACMCACMCACIFSTCG